MVLSDARQLEVDFLHSLAVVLPTFSNKIIVSLRVKEPPTNTNLVPSRHIKRENSSLSIDVCHSKMSLLYKLPFIGNCLLQGSS